MNKKTLIFDATNIAEAYRAQRGRSGIYFTACNVLKELLDVDCFDVSLYSGAVYHKDFEEFIRTEFGRDLKIYRGNKFGSILLKLSDLDLFLRKSKLNITKFLLNVFVRKPLWFVGQEFKLPHFDIALSMAYVFDKKIKADKKYLILYDAIPLLIGEYFPSKKHWFYNLTEYIKTKPVCKYFAISKSCKDDFVRLLDVNPDDITVIPLAANNKNFYHESDNKKIMAARKKYNIPADKKYVFSLCTLEPRKNLIRAVKTFIEFIKKNKIDDMVFVLGGAHWGEFIGKLESEIDDLGKYKDKIIRAGYIDDADLAALYSGAEWFVYTSQYEGFGLPPLEAMQCGCPVITSNNSSLPEVVGDAGIMIDWDDDDAHIAAYEKYYFDNKYRTSMAKKGLTHSKDFSWKNTVDIIIKTIQGEK